MQFQQSLHTRRHENGRISTIRFHNLKYLEGNCMQNLSPGDERQPQGLRAHIHTFTMRAFSDSSAKKFAQHTPISSISDTKLAQHTPTNTTPDTKLAQQPLSHRMCGTKLAQQLLSHRMCGTKLALHTPSHRMCGTKLAQHAAKSPIWALFRVQGEFIHACGSNSPSRRIPLASSAAFEARHTATDLYTPIMAAPLISREDQHTAADLCTHDPAIVVDTGDHRQDRIERKNAHA